jgi:transposase
LPILERLETTLRQPGLLYVGDCKMSAFDIRAYVPGKKHLYLSPLPLTGSTAKQMPQWISEGIAKAKSGELESTVKVNDRDEEIEVAQGYEFDRPCCIKEATSLRRWWHERVLVIHSPTHAQQQVIEKVRYQITEVRRDDERVANLKAGLEWKAFVTNATAKRLSLAEAVWGYRHEYRIERIFSRLKSRLQIAPMYVKREDQIEGLTYLLTLGVRAVSQHVSSQVCGVGNDIRTPARITAVQYRPGLIHGVVPQQRALAGARRSQEHVR